MEECARKVPLFDPAEEVARQAASMLTIRDPSGRPVWFEWSVGPTRADTFTLLAQIADGARRRDYIEQGLQAAQAIADQKEVSLFLAELSLLCPDHEQERMQLAALDLAASIEWEATRSEVVVRIAPYLGPQAIDVAFDMLKSFEIDEVRSGVEAHLLIHQGLLSDQDTQRVMSALEASGEDREDEKVRVIEVLADRVDDTQVDHLVILALGWRDDSATSAVIAALAHRLSPNRTLDLLTSRSWRVDAIEAMIRSLPEAEQGMAVQWVYESVIEHPSPRTRVECLGMLLRIDHPGLDRDKLTKLVDTAMAQIITLNISPTELANLARNLPVDPRYKEALVTAAFDRREILEQPKKWGEVVDGLSGVALPTLLPKLLASLEPLDGEARAVGLRGLSKHIAQQLPAEAQWDAWKQILRFTDQDSRRDLLAQMRSTLPLIERLAPKSLMVEVGHEVLRIQRWFP
jgi:uncharacterized protein (DUF2267 family)